MHSQIKRYNSEMAQQIAIKKITFFLRTINIFRHSQTTSDLRCKGVPILEMDHIIMDIKKN